MSGDEKKLLDAEFAMRRFLAMHGDARSLEEVRADVEIRSRISKDTAEYLIRAIEADPDEYIYTDGGDGCPHRLSKAERIAHIRNMIWR